MRPKDSKVRKKEQDTPTSPKSTEADLPEEGEVVDIVFETSALQEEASAEIEAVDEADEDMAEILDKSILGSMISALEAMGEKEEQKTSTEAGAVGEEEEAGVDMSSDSDDLKEERPTDFKRLLSQEKPAAPSSISIEDSLSPASGNEAYSGPTLEEKSMLGNNKEDTDRISKAVGPEEERRLDSTDVGPAEEKPLPQGEPTPDLVSFEDLMAKRNEEELHHEPAGEEMPAPGVAVLEERLELIRDEIRALKSSTLSTMVGRIGRPFVLFGILVVFLAIQVAPFVPLGGEQAQKPWKKIVEILSPKKQDTPPETSTETPSAAKQGVQLSTADPSSQSLLVKKEIVRAPVLKRQETIPKKSIETIVAAEQKVRPLASESSTVPAKKETVETTPPKKLDTTPKPSAKTVVAAKREETHEDNAKVQTVHRETVTSYPYSVYLGSYGSLERAEKAIIEYKEDGLSSLYWQEVDLGEKGVWYRIFTGHFENREKGEELIKEKRLAGAEVKRMEDIEPRPSKSPSPVIQPSDGTSKAGTEAKAVFTSFPYSVYLGSYKTLDRARTVALDSPNVSYWVRIDLGEKGIWYRVFIGYFRTRDEAGTFIEEHQIADGESKLTPYANLIGTYRSDEESNQMNRSLLELGFCPYVIKEADGRSRLFTGAFYQRERAEKEHRDLTAKGIQSQLVKR